MSDQKNSNRFGDFRFYYIACILAAVQCASVDAANGTNEVHAAMPESTNETAALNTKQKPSIVDTVQRSTSTRIVGLARWVDSFFDDPEYAEEEANARASLQQTIKFYRNLEPEYRTRVRASVVLPNLNRRFRLTFEADDETDSEDPADPTDPSEENFTESTQDSIDNPSVRLNYFFLQRPDADLGLTAGVRLSRRSFYFGPRITLDADIEPGWHAKLIQRIYWYTTNDLKSKTELRFDHLLGKHNLFRQAFRLDWDEETHETDGFRPSATTSITQPLKRDAALRYAWSSAYSTRPDPGWTSTTLSVGYRQSIWRRWIILEVTPFVTWEDEFNWKPKPGIAITFNAIFDKE